MSDEQGRFRLKAEDLGVGPVVGWHRVTVEDMAIFSAPRSPDGTLLQKPPVRFGPPFGDPLRTPLRQEVRPGPQTVEVEVTPGS